MQPLPPTRPSVLFRFLWWQRVGEGDVVVMLILLQGLDRQGIKVNLAMTLVHFTRTKREGGSLGLRRLGR
jgi:hypothetical protein